MRLTIQRVLLFVHCVCLLVPVAAQAEFATPDDEPADMSKPVQVYILLGQSNMVGSGLKGKPWRPQHADNPITLYNAVFKAGLYPFLKGGTDEKPAYAMRMDARHTCVMDGGPSPKVTVNDWLSPAKANGWRIGPEFGLGWKLAEQQKAPVLVLKSCAGNRSLGWDLMSPSSKAYEFEGKLNPGYGEVPETAGTGKRPEKVGWYAGIQFDADVKKAMHVLENLGEFYPGATEYEVAGFFFWQGTRDASDPAHAANYERHLVNFIKDMRSAFDAPKAPFVIATLAQSVIDEQGNYLHDDLKDGKGVIKSEAYKLILDAHLAVDGASGKYPEFKGNVKTVYAHPLSMGGSSGGHYNNDARTYMNVGLGMGDAMVELLKGK